MIGRLYRKTGNAAKACAAFQEYIDLLQNTEVDGDQVDAALYVGQYYARQAHDFDLATKYLTKAMELGGQVSCCTYFSFSPKYNNIGGRTGQGRTAWHPLGIYIFNGSKCLWPFLFRRWFGNSRLVWLSPSLCASHARGSQEIDQDPTAGKKKKEKKKSYFCCRLRCLLQSLTPKSKVLHRPVLSRLLTVPRLVVAEYFSLVDAEGKGVIKGDQVEVLMRALGHNPTKAELAGKDDDHKQTRTQLTRQPNCSVLLAHKQLDLTQFLAVMPRKRTPISKDAVKQALDTLEKYNGVVTKDGLKHLVKNVGYACSCSLSPSPSPSLSLVVTNQNNHRDKLTDREWDEFLADGSVTFTSDGRVNAKSTPSPAICFLCLFTNVFVWF